MKTSRVVAMTAAVTILVLLLLGVTWIYSGRYDPAADGGTGLLANAAGVMTDRSIAARARALTPPATLDAAMLTGGAERYQALCTGCHGAPGVPRDMAGEGLMPQPPELARTRMSEAEVYWVIRNGIRGRGMPSYRKSLTDEQMWAIARFAKSTAGMTEQEYEAVFRRIMDEAGEASPGHNH